MNFKRISLLLSVSVFLLLASCEKHQRQWQFERKIILPKESRPLALAMDGEDIWFSDPDYFRIYKIDLNGKVLDSIVGIQRPMNIHSTRGTLYIPEFLTDSIWKYNNGKISLVNIKNRPQAPAGVSVYGDTVLIADFYNHRIIVETHDESFTIGKQGHKEGELYYPIDVKFYDRKIYVADAYNHRIQVFDFEGTHQKIIGQNDKINVASGIALDKYHIAVTDQENSRVLVYARDGKLLQLLNEEINYPTDVLLTNDLLFIANFKENTITIYALKE